MKRIAVCLSALIIFSAGCSSNRQSGEKESGTIRIKGSDSMLLLVQRLADRYLTEHPDKNITVEGGGSGLGVQSLIKGTSDICAASRPLTPEEVRMIAQRYQSLGVSILCAKDALSIVIHPSNPVRNLTEQQIKGIFTGAVTDWSELGGPPGPITVFRRESNSGTYLYFEDHVLLGEEYSSNSISVPGARAMINAVAAESSAIGYSTSVYASGVNSVSVNGAEPTMVNVRQGRYPISRYLYFYTVNPPEGDVKKFVDWVTGREGQRTVKENGYVPLYETE
ncbi:MAG: phosphate ABC transporter substrate-binding protein [Bacteroidetes bacterium]|nr:phosphate ABC transporter substrate-binding protein [Bacteroidota bacterium]